MALSISRAVCLRLGIKGISLVFLLMTGLPGCGVKKQATDKLPFYNSADFTAEWIDSTDAAYNRIHTIDTFSMHDQTGHVYSSDSLKGRIYVANFFFTICPTICPKMMANIKLIQERFADNDQLRMVSFSVMPWVDSVGRLAVYGKEQKINPDKWHLLTGDAARVYTLGRQSFFAEKKLGLTKDSSEFLHTESMLLIDKKGRIRGIYSATQPKEMDRATADIQTLLKE